MPNASQTGENTVVTWTPTDPSASLVTLSTYGRNIEINQEADTYDSTTYAEAQAGYRSKVKGLGDADAKMEVMYQTADTTIFPTLAPRTVGTLIVYREGNTNGKPKETYTAIVTKRTRPHPYDDLMVMSVEWEFSGAPSYGTVSP